MRFLFISILMSLVIIQAMSLISCRSTKNQEEMKIPVDFTVSFGSGGGASGMWTGFSVNAEGVVQKWGGKIQEENPKYYDKVEIDSVRAAWKKIKDFDFFKIDHIQPANFSSYLKITGEDQANIIIWNPMAENDSCKAFNKLLNYFNNAFLQNRRK